MLIPMQLNPSIIEQVTAVTNVPLALISLAAVARLWRRRLTNPIRTCPWIGVFGGLAIGSGVGVFAHGLDLAPTAERLLWHPINGALSLAVACFAAGAVLDRWGPRPAGRALPLLLLSSAAFFGYASFFATSFLPFVLYEGVAMLFSLVIYLTLTIQRSLAGAGWMVAGIGITILAAVLQATPAVVLQIGVTFDHNGVFHLMQLPGLLCLLTGLQMGLDSKPQAVANTKGMIASGVG
jgi:hypothetical protein